MSYTKLPKVYKNIIVTPRICKAMSISGRSHLLEMWPDGSFIDIFLNPFWNGCGTPLFGVDSDEFSFDIGRWELLSSLQLGRSVWPPIQRECMWHNYHTSSIRLFCHVSILCCNGCLHHKIWVYDRSILRALFVKRVCCRYHEGWLCNFWVPLIEWVFLPFDV